jgi:hypothetical protein
VNANYAWMKFYEAAVLETNSEVLPERIEAAQRAIGQRVITLAVDEAERRAIVKTLNALGILKRERAFQRMCSVQKTWRRRVGALHVGWRDGCD